MERYKLMIVEDEAIIRKGLVRMVPWESLGFQVIAEAANGKKALQCIEAEEPDVILTDIRMPIMDGLQLMSAVREQRPRIRLVVLSGYEDFSYAQHAIHCGVLGYLIKPSRDEEIRRVFDRVRETLDEGKGREASASEAGEKREPFTDPLIRQAEEYLDERFSEKVSLEDVARIVYMNPSYFSTFFKKKTGKGFTEYLTGLRMKKARELALTSDLKTYHISVMVGYDDARYFSRLFRETYGQSIAEMRKAERDGRA